MTAPLPALPESAELVTPDAAVIIERRIANEIALLEDIGVAREWLARADALAAYLKHKDAEGPMLGAMRRVEARIGELLGPDKLKGGRGIKRPGADGLHRQRIKEFQSLAYLVERGVLDYASDGDQSPWRASRETLLLHELLRNMGGLKSSTSVEWYTPATYIEAARHVLGGIDLDPASNAQANEEVVKATTFYDQETDGLERAWHGRVFCNPPYGKGTGLFVTKMLEEHAAGRTTAAILLINAYGFDARWFQPLWEHTFCFTDHRIEFWSPQRKSGGPANGNLFVYLGPDRWSFVKHFRPFGNIVRAWP